MAFSLGVTSLSIKQETYTALRRPADSLDMGAVFRVSNDGTEVIFCSFAEPGADGQTPVGIALDDAGNLYGTTIYGGSVGAGTVYKIAPNGTETVLHSFIGSDGAAPKSISCNA